MEGGVAMVEQVVSTPCGQKDANKGFTLSAFDAMKYSGWDFLSISEWKRKEGIVDSERIKLVRLSHMRYMNTDFEAITKFLTDFGMHLVKRTDDVMWWRGYSSEPYVCVIEKGLEKKFLGGAFAVDSYAELEKATKLPGASKIEKMDAAPGGGFRVVVADPAGFLINLIAGQELAHIGEVPQNLIYNYENKKVRQGAFQRFSEGPAAVHRLGHFGLCVLDLQKQIKFYTRTFNLVPSDLLYVPNPNSVNEQLQVGLFAHIDLGDEYVDHHSFFLSSSSSEHIHHCAFEVHDFDTQLLGHQWLAKKEYKSVWGVGRHVLGSQIFDYWWDTAGNMMEHYTDGDTVNDKSPIGLVPAGSESMAVWGPDLPSEFLG